MHYLSIELFHSVSDVLCMSKAMNGVGEGNGENSRQKLISLLCRLLTLTHKPPSLLKLLHAGPASLGDSCSRYFRCQMASHHPTDG